MADPSYQDPQYSAYTHPPPATAAFYAPPDSLYQNPPYDYESQQPYAQQFPPNQASPYGSHYDLTQPPPHPPPPPSSGQAYLSPASAANRSYPENHHGSNAEYYNPHEETLPPPSPHPSHSSRKPRNSPGNNKRDPKNGAAEDEEEEKDPTDRSVGGTLVGGATGYYLGHKKSHGLLGA
ncbi:hypothetical protein FE257_006980 [Aspergillus nanangensis]|uniref:Uncharacterized protein n=1 Tax=Aspergillus nanangensis TaxID=2582783 RepID=A0AAD4CN96_ASPNN|nr:hypothetical protein FE257_006980 [Aspergillus nanangensis]